MKGHTEKDVSPVSQSKSNSTADNDGRDGAPHSGGHNSFQNDSDGAGYSGQFAQNASATDAASGQNHDFIWTTNNSLPNVQNAPLDRNHSGMPFNGSWIPKPPLTNSTQPSFGLLEPGSQTQHQGQSEPGVGSVTAQQANIDSAAPLNPLGAVNGIGMPWPMGNQGGTAMAMNELQSWLYPLDRDLLSSLHTYTTSPLPTPYFNALPVQETSNEPYEFSLGEAAHIKSVPRERFSRVERAWNAQQNRPMRLQPTLWKDIIFYPMENLFSNGMASKLDPRDGSSWGLDAECQCQLEAAFGVSTVRSSDISANSTLSSPQDFQSRTKFPPATILDIALGLFFRRFHPSLPFIHIPTFCIKTTPKSLLLAICLNGLSILGTTGATEFVAQMFPVVLHRTFIDLASFSNGPTNTADQVTTIATAILTINLAAAMGSETYIAQCQMLYTTLLALTQRHGLLSSAADIDLRSQLATVSGPEAQWKAWSRAESMKRLICSIPIIDSFYANHLSDCPILRSDKIQIFAPCDEILFQAKSAAQWEHLAKNMQLFMPAIASNHLELDLGSFGNSTALSVAQIQILELYQRYIQGPEKAAQPVPWREYEHDTRAEDILKFTLIGTKSSTPRLREFDINCMMWWHSLCIMLLANSHIFDLAAGRHGPDPASDALDQIAKWSLTPEARRACVHAAQNYKLMSSRRVSEIITMHSVSALFVSSLVLGLYIFMVPPDQHGPTVELINVDVDWQDLATIGTVDGTTVPSPDHVSPHRQQGDPLTSPIASFIKTGGVVSLSGTPHSSGYESARRVLLDFATLMDGTGERKSRTLSQILHIMCDDLMSVDNVR